MAPLCQLPLAALLLLVIAAASSVAGALKSSAPSPLNLRKLTAAGSSGAPPASFAAGGLPACQDAVEAAQATITNRTAELTAAQVQLAGLQANITAEQNELAAVNTDLASAQSALATCDQNVASAQNQLASIQAAILQIGVQSVQCASDVQACVNRYDSCQAALAKMPGCYTG